MSRSSRPRIPSAGSHSTEGAAYRQMIVCHCTCGVPAHRVCGHADLRDRERELRADLQAEGFPLPAAEGPSGLLAMPEQSSAMSITTDCPAPAGTGPRRISTAPSLRSAISASWSAASR